MSAAALDRLLAILVAALLVTGLFSLRAGSPPTAPLFVLHGVLARQSAGAVALKLRRSVPRAARPLTGGVPWALPCCWPCSPWPPWSVASRG